MGNISRFCLKKKQFAGGVTKVVEHLPTKHKVSSTPVPPQKNSVEGSDIVALARNPSYSGGKDEEDHGIVASQHKNLKWSQLNQHAEHGGMYLQIQDRRHR
jgi:hypothetical protein